MKSLLRQTLGMLYRRYLHGEDLPQEPLKSHHPGDHPGEGHATSHLTHGRESGACGWVDYPRELPNGILFGARGEHDLLSVFGKVNVTELKGKSLLIHPQLLNIAGKPRYTIRFRGLK